MTRMNSRKRRLVYAYLAKYTGEYCKICGVRGNEHTLVVDHMDNNDDHDHPDNHQLLCRRCNYLKNPRRPVDSCESVRTVEEAPTEIEANRMYEPHFLEYLDERFQKDAYLDAKDFVNSSAEVIGCSPITTKRYLSKVTSGEGNYQLVSIDKQIIIQQRTNNYGTEELDDNTLEGFDNFSDIIRNYFIEEGNK